VTLAITAVADEARWCSIACGAPDSRDDAGLAGTDDRSLAAIIDEAEQVLQRRRSLNVAGVTLRTIEAARRDGDAIFATVRITDDTSGVELVQLDRSSIEETLPLLREGPWDEWCLLRGADKDALAIAAMAVHDRVLPPCGAWPRIDESESRPFVGTTRMQPWLSVCGTRPLRAMAGRPGAWVLVESADGERRPPPSPLLGTELLVLSADTREELLARIEGLGERFASQSMHDVAQMLAQETLRVHRASVVASSPEQAVTAFAALLPRIRDAATKRFRSRNGAQYADTVSARREGKIAFLFPGQGSYYASMHAELVPRSPYMRQWFEELDRLAVACGDRFAHNIYPPAHGLSPARRQKIERRLLEPEIGGQAGIAGSLALVEHLRSGGVRPDAVAGHSNGENAALAAAGIVPIEEREQILSLLALMRTEGEEAEAGGRIPKGTCCAVSGVSLNDLLALPAVKNGTIHLMMDNCPNQRVLFGPDEAMQAAKAELAAQGALSVTLPLDRGYHTPLFARKAAHIREIYADFPFLPPRIPIYSSMTAAPMPADPDGIRDVAAMQWASTVRFRETIENLYASGVRIFIEVGAGSKLTGFVNDTLRGRDYLALASDVEGHSALASLQQLIADLALAGRINRYGALLPCSCRACAAAVVFSPEKVRAPRRDALRTTIIGQHFALMNQWLCSEEALAAQLFSTLRGPATKTVQRTLSLSSDPWLQEHALGRNAVPVVGGRALPIVPLMVTLDLLADAALQIERGVVTRIDDVRAHRWIALDSGDVTLRITAERRPDGRIATAVYDGAACCAEGNVTIAATFERAEARPAISSNGFTSRVDARSFYALLFHGPALQSIRGARALSGSIINCDAVMPPPAADFHTPAMLLDASGQTAGWWLLEVERTLCNIFPFEIGAVTFHAPTPAAGHPLQIRASVDAGADVVTTSTDFVAGDSLLARVTNLRMRRFAAPPRLAELLAGKRATLTDGTVWKDLEIASVSDVPLLFLTSANEIWLRALAQLFLAPSEHDTWRALARGKRRAQWLMGRIAAKEALLRLASRALGMTLRGCEIEIEADREGRPAARARKLVVAGATPAISIAHAGDHVVAAATFAFEGLGIDVEVPRQPDADLRAGFSDEELALVPPASLLPLWCAKEAAAKALGSGLRGAPREWRVVAYDGQQGIIEYQGRRLEVSINLQAGHCLAVCATAIRERDDAIRI
jgi:malonyl CoA-acyl carrier protein transacylase/phosphopantetheinyl transferase